MEKQKTTGVNYHLDIGLVISEALKTFRRLFGVFLLASLLLFLFNFAVFRVILNNNPWSWLITLPIGMVSSGLYEAVIVGATKLDREGQPKVSLLTIMSVVQARVVPLILASLIPAVALVLVVGTVTPLVIFIALGLNSAVDIAVITILMLHTVLLGIPGLFFMVRWALVAPAVVIEHQGPLKCLGRSDELVKGNSWPVFFVIFAILLFARIGSFFPFLLGDNLVAEAGIRLAGGPIGILGAVAPAVIFFELKRLEAVRAEHELGNQP